MSANRRRYDPLLWLLSRLLLKNRVSNSPVAITGHNRPSQFQLLLGCILLLGAVTSLSYAQIPLANFNGSANGAAPQYGYPIAIDVSGNGYGTTYAGGTYDEGTVFQLTPGGTLTTIYSFCSQINCADGAEPESGLVAAGGNYYGTTFTGGANGLGTVFVVTKTGILTRLHSFAGGPTEGAYPVAGLVLATDGNFYGTTSQGGNNFSGTVFKITPSGQLTTLYSFCSQTNCSDGTYPTAGLVLASNGNFYGTTAFGGSTQGGTVFEITPAGHLTTLYTFCSLTNCTDGEQPWAGLVQATNGNLYGTTAFGGVNGGTGTIFEMTPSGQLTTVYNFCSQTFCTDGTHPHAGLLQASDGNLYGTAQGGAGPNLWWSFGTVFGMTPAGQLTTLYDFCAQSYCSDGAYPYGGLAESGSGILFGATNYGGSYLDGTTFTLPLGLVPAKTPAASGNKAVKFAGIGHGADAAAPTARLRSNGAMVPDLSIPRITTPAPRTRAKSSAIKKVAVANNSAPPVTSILDLDGANGAFPYLNSLTQGNDGNLYGTTTSGGAYEDGTVFQLTPGGTLTTIYTFCSLTNCADGVQPFSGLVQATNGNFYGTTPLGGIGAGTVYEITPAGVLTTLHNFCSEPGCADGNYSQAGLVQASNGYLYGTTSAGGGPNNGGVVFDITPAGQLTTLYNFCSLVNCTDGTNPVGGLVQASNGNLYGTTNGGGANAAGTVFQITLGGTLTTLYSFCSQINCADGSNPSATLVQASDGNLYGTTNSDGVNFAGTVFRITPAGQLTTLYTFCSQPGCTDGDDPIGGLVEAGGNLYGTAAFGGIYGYGTVYEITPAGQLTTIYNFGLSDGAYPESALVLGSNGNLYGMTDFGGDRLGGTIFNLPPVISLSGPTGTAQVGVPYSSSLVATGGVAPYTYSIVSGSLPPVLLLNTSTGAITGTPTTAGAFNFTAEVVDSKGNSATVICSILVTSGTNPSTTTLSLTPSSIAAGSVGPVVMAATVAPLSGSGTPTGSVAYFNGSTQVGTATLSGGVAQLNFNPSSLAVGLYSITAVYGGDNTFAGSTSQPQTLFITQTGPFAYVANLNSNTVSMINIPSGQVVNSISVGPGPIEVAISPNGQQVYASNNHGNDVAVIDTASSTVVATIPVQSAPFGLAFTPDGTAAYVVNGSSDSVSVIDTASQTVVATVAVQSKPIGVAMASTSMGTFAYVTNSGSNTVSVIAVGPSPTVVQTINVGSDPYGIAASPNSSLVYVANAKSNNVSAISVASNTVTATIPVGTAPFGVAFTPDSSMAYVANTSNTVSVIDAAASRVISTVTGLNNPVRVAISSDGALAYATNLLGNNVSVISTTSNTITGTIPVGSAPFGVATASSPATTLKITQPLSPTQPTVFNYGTNSFTVQYPPGSNFSNIDMTTEQVEITPAQFRQRVAGTQFAKATCIVYSGAGGNCIDYEVTCSSGGNPIACPSEPQPTIEVDTSFNTLQPIINPGFLTTPIGQNQWTNIFAGLSDLTIKGKTQGFSEFVGVDLGVSNRQGLAQLSVISPKFPATVKADQPVTVAVELKSVANGSPITNAKINMTVEMIADGNGNPVQKVVFSGMNCFREAYTTGIYEHTLSRGAHPPGTYTVIIYGDSFASFQGQVVVK